MVSEVASCQTVGSAWKARQHFVRREGEALYGLGSHQEGHMNLRGTMQYLYQHNLEATILVFVRAGAVIPMGPFQQYSSEKPDAPWEIRVYLGADCEFTVYEDEGDGYGYEKGFCSTFTLTWDDRERSQGLLSSHDGHPPSRHRNRRRRLGSRHRRHVSGGCSSGV